jgi:D-inositol-3-phosphate glycosyltransferase
LSKKIKIALLKNGPYTTGGVSSVCRFIYQSIAPLENYEIQLFSLETSHNHSLNVRVLSPKTWFSGVRAEEYLWNSLRVKHFGIFLPELEFLRYKPNRQMAELLNEYDLVQVVSGGPATANILKFIDKPVCLFIATLVGLERKSQLRGATILRRAYGRIMLPIVSMIEKQALRNVDHIFAETDYTRQAILPYVDASKISIDTVGVDTNLFVPIAETHRTDDFILSVGRFDDPRKNVTLLFEAFALLCKQVHHPPKLVLAGKTAPVSSALSRAGDLGIDKYIEIKKDVSFEDLITLYQNAAVYVLSSDEEGLGIVLLEAMACATPVISTRCGGPDSVVSDKLGLLTSVGDSHEMAEALLWMLQNQKKRRNMGLAGRQMVESRFSNQVVAKKYLDVYKKLLGVENS